jgi:glycosyltransferase involved in cell wall biosynthesis
MVDSTKEPMISVIMPVFNGERFLREAIDSILAQTFSDFEFIIIDDGSKDRSLAIIQDYAAKDSRIQIVVNDVNIGIAKSLNKGIDIAQGKYIARMDADDISLPERFQKQVEFMEIHPEIGALGGNTQVIDTDGNFKKFINLPSSNPLILWLMCFENPMCHPSTLIRYELLHQVGGYRDFRASEDYDLWQRMSEITRLANLDQTIVLYRLHGGNLSSLPNKSRSMERNDIRQRAITHILGKNAKINWHLYWNDPYYSAKLIFQIQQQLRHKASKEERKIIINESSRKVFHKARSMPRKMIVQKCIIYSVAIFLNPRLLKEFVNTRFSNQGHPT